MAGRTGQEYNQRKDRKGAFWEDRYHATAIESGEHLLRCIVYIDLNMVRAGIVDHPSQWPFCGYNEIQEPRRKNVLINYEKLRELAGAESYDLLKRYRQGWVEKYLGNGNNIRDDKWTKGIAVGSKGFVEHVKSALGALAKGRKAKESGDSYQLREPSAPYGEHFGVYPVQPFLFCLTGVKNEDIGLKNTYFWNFNPE